LKATYAILLVFALLPVLAFGWEKQLRFYKRIRFTVPGIFLVATPFLLWDSWFAITGAWGFNPDYVLGCYVFTLPIEEVLFFFIVPISCIFIYEAIGFYWPNGLLRTAPLLPQMVLIPVLLGCIIFHYTSIYTVVNFSACLLLLVGLLWFSPPWLSRFWLGFLVSLLGFLVVNGVLTFLPVVWYSSKAIMGYRIVSIPVEDFVYCLCLMLGNVWLYEQAKQNKMYRTWLTFAR